MINQRQKHLQTHLQNTSLEMKSGVYKLREAFDRSEIGPYGLKKRYNCPQRIRNLSRPKLPKVVDKSFMPDKNELLNKSANYSNFIRNRSFSRYKAKKVFKSKDEIPIEDLDLFEKRLNAVKRESNPQDLKILSYNYKKLNYY